MNDNVPSNKFHSIICGDRKFLKCSDCLKNLVATFEHSNNEKAWMVRD